jgi:hypothetical protein
LLPYDRRILRRVLPCWRILRRVVRVEDGVHGLGTSGDHRLELM